MVTGPWSLVGIPLSPVTGPAQNPDWERLEGGGFLVALGRPF